MGQTAPRVGFPGTPPAPSPSEMSLPAFFVQELSRLGLGSDTEVELRTLQLPVDYREVEQRVARIWEDLQPQVNDDWGW